MIKCLLTELGRAGRENIWPSVMAHGPRCARSVRHDLGPNIFPSGPPTQSISTYYWPEVVAVRPERSEFPSYCHDRVRPEQARFVSCLFYGTLFLIVKCTSDAINLFSFLSLNLFSFFW